MFTFNLEKKNIKFINFDVYNLYFNELFGLQFKINNEFIEFMKTEKQSAKMTEDQWNLFLELMKVIGDQFPKGFNIEEAWPTLFDEFYLWYCKKYDIIVQKPEY